MQKKQFQYVRTFAPASVSNLNCGFDVLGFALHAPGDEVELRRNNSGVVSIETITGDGGLLPRDADKNTASAVVRLFLDKIGSRQGIAVGIHKKMPLNSGLGSSAASSVAALLAVNTLMGEPLARKELLPLAMEGERLACGNAHADNVAPALFGGLVLIRSYTPLDIVQLPVPETLFCAIIHPEVSVPTREARSILPEKIPLRDAVKQWGNLAGLVAALYSNDLSLLSRSMTDHIVEPVREHLIPDFSTMKQLATDAGALAFGISGSGPTVFAFADGLPNAQIIANAIAAFLTSSKMPHQVYLSAINPLGAQLLIAE